MVSDSTDFQRLVQTIKTLRSDEGCPWDKKQTTDSLKKYLNEEFLEIIAAIENQDPPNLCEELGDFLYLIVMLAEINHQNNNFSIADVVGGINEKLIRRHPHVFSDKRVVDEITLRKQWQQIKDQEKNNKK